MSGATRTAAPQEPLLQPHARRLRTTAAHLRGDVCLQLLNHSRHVVLQVHNASSMLFTDASQRAIVDLLAYPHAMLHLDKRQFESHFLRK